MLVIRLARTGRNKYPTYRIVAAESARAVTGKFVAILGHYNPHTKELVLKKDDILKYVGNGAQPSNSVVRLLQREKLELPAWVQLKAKNKAPKKEAAAEPQAAPTEVVADETPTEQATAEPAAEPETVAEQAVAEEEKVEAEAVAPADPDVETTETAEMEQGLAGATEKAEEVAAEAAVDAAKEPEKA